MPNGLQGVIDPAVVAGVLRQWSPQPEHHCAVMEGGKFKKLLQAAHTLVGNHVLLPLGQGMHRPEGVILQDRDSRALGGRGGCVQQGSNLSSYGDKSWT